MSNAEEDDESEDENDEENDDDKKYDKDVINIADLEPSLKKVQEAMNKVNLLLQKKLLNLNVTYAILMQDIQMD